MNMNTCCLGARAASFVVRVPHSWSLEPLPPQIHPGSPHSSTQMAHRFDSAGPTRHIFGIPKSQTPAWLVNVVLHTCITIRSRSNRSQRSSRYTRRPAHHHHNRRHISSGRYWCRSSGRCLRVTRGPGPVAKAPEAAAAAVASVRSWHRRRSPHSRCPESTMSTQSQARRHRNRRRSNTSKCSCRWRALRRRQTVQVTRAAAAAGWAVATVPEAEVCSGRRARVWAAQRAWTEQCRTSTQARRY